MIFHHLPQFGLARMVLKVAETPSYKPQVVAAQDLSKNPQEEEFQTFSIH